MAFTVGLDLVPELVPDFHSLLREGLDVIGLGRLLPASHDLPELRRAGAVAPLRTQDSPTTTAQNDRWTLPIKPSRSLIHCRPDELERLFGHPAKVEFSEQIHYLEAMLWSHVSGHAFASVIPSDVYFNLEMQFANGISYLVSFRQLGRRSALVSDPIGDNAAFQLVCFAVGRYDRNRWELMPKIKD